MKIKIKPIEGKIVRKPDTKLPLKAEGEEVEKSSFWVRRLKDGDVELVQEKKEVVINKQEKNK